MKSILEHIIEFFKRNKPIEANKLNDPTKTADFYFEVEADEPKKKIRQVVKLDFEIPFYDEIEKVYGKPGDTSNLITIDIPYPMRLSWDHSIKVSRLTCHKKVADSLLSILNHLLDHYGLERLQKLGIDIFGGCYNLRPMRGTDEDDEKWSTHSWGIAFDLDPLNNRLKWGSDMATFATPAYKPMLRIFEIHGWYNLGVYRNFDWMHTAGVKQIKR